MSTRAAKPPKPKPPKPGRSSGPDVLRVRMYNVLFGDAILVSVPESDGVTRHILIDVGNVTGKGGDDDVFDPVIKDVLAELNGEALDLYVMTHEHMDHVQGLLYASDRMQLKIKKKLNVQYAWLTASAEPNYYNSHPDAKKRKLEADEVHRTVARFLMASYLDENPGAKLPAGVFDDLYRFAAAADKPDAPAFPQALGALLLNNDYQETGKCVDYLRNLADKRRTYYVHREMDPRGKHPFKEATLEIWAPEKDTTEYYGRFRPLGLGVAGDGGAGVRPTLAAAVPPAGVDAGAFYDLVKARRRGLGDSLLQIDAANNNTSVVFCLEWRGWRLLFPGDAEERSWKVMKREGRLKPVHFLKVGHHGSHNGTPPPELLDLILPEKAPDKKQRHAGVSTCANVYPGKSEDTAVPHEATIEELKKRCQLVSVEGLAKGAYHDFTFPG
jgi:hypothetical protein